eukprot:350649-Chlamydomonas_euryale.AAC.2
MPLCGPLFPTPPPPGRQSLRWRQRAATSTSRYEPTIRLLPCASDSYEVVRAHALNCCVCMLDCCTLWELLLRTAGLGARMCCPAQPTFPAFSLPTTPSAPLPMS